MNSLFDPNRTGTGHQPYGFDQLSTFYNRYYVTGSKMTVTFSCQTKDNDTTVTGPILIGVTGRAETTFATQNADNWAEYPNADTQLLSTDTTRIVSLLQRLVPRCWGILNPTEAILLPLLRAQVENGLGFLGFSIQGQPP